MKSFSNWQQRREKEKYSKFKIVTKKIKVVRKIIIIFAPKII